MTSSASPEKKHAARRKRPPRPQADAPLLLVFDDDSAPTAREDFLQKNAHGAHATVTAEAVLRYIALNQGVNTPRLAAFFVKTLKTIARFTTELRYRKFVEFRGPKLGGGYFLLPAGLAFLQNPQSAEKFVPRQMSGTLVLDFIRTHPGANHFHIAAEFKRTIKSVARHTQALRKKGLIVFLGTPRDGGFYPTKHAADAPFPQKPPATAENGGNASASVAGN